MHEGSGKRSSATRNAIVAAYNRVFLERRLRRIRVGHVAAEAGVGRSTLYDHFSGAEPLHMAALTPLLAILADAAAGRGDPAAIERLLAHFWEYRQRAPETFGGRAGEQTMRLLAELVEDRLEAPLALPRRLAARQLAAATAAPVRAWLLGEAPSTPDLLAANLCRSGAALAAALRAPD